MKPNEQQRLFKAIMRWEPRTPKEMESLSKFQEYIKRRKKKIQTLVNKSVCNQIYIFPRKRVPSSDSSSSISDHLHNKEEYILYDLAKQNKRNKSYQHSSQIYFKHFSQIKDHNAKEKLLNETFHKNQLHLSLNKGKMDKSYSPIKASSKKHKKQQQKTVLNSSKKLIVAEQYSLGTHPNQAHTKKSSENATLSCRWKPPRTRTKTEV